MSDDFWLNNPSILFHRNLIKELWPTKEMSTNQKLNAITRLVIILTLLGYLMTKTVKILITGLVTLISIIILRKVAFTKKAKADIKQKGLEAFTSPKLYRAAKESFNEPTHTNPMMNPMMNNMNPNSNCLNTCGNGNSFQNQQKKQNENSCNLR